MPLFSKINWEGDRADAFLSWIQRELINTLGDRASLEDAWENAVIQWRSRHSREELDFPYPGASNLEIPLTAMHSDPVYADMMQSFGAPADYWTPTARRQDTMDLVSALRRGMTQVERRYLKMRDINGSAFLENIVVGSAFYKNGWKSETRRRRLYLPDGSTRVTTINVSHPSIEHIPIQRLIFPAYAWSLDFDAPGGTPWIAQEFRWTRAEWERYKQGSAELPGFDKDAVESISNWFIDEDERVRRQTQIDDKNQPFEDIHVKLYEVWARFPTQEDGVYDDICVVLHLESLKMLRAIYFPNAHGKHPFHSIKYLPGFGIYGIGMAEIDEWSQEAATQILNAQIDNARLANTRMFKAPLGSSFQQNSGVFPGKVWYLGPDEDVGEVRLSEVYPSGFQLLNNLMQFAELRTGVSELRQGNLSGLPSRTPATSLLSILREGNKRFDLVHTNTRTTHGEMGLRWLQNLAQRAQEDVLTWQAFFSRSVGEADAQKIMQVLLQPNVDQIEEAFGITVTATSAQVNKEVEKQNFIGMMQVVQQIYQALVQTALLMVQVPDPVVKATAASAFASGVDILGQLLERFDVQNPQEHLGQLEAIAAQLQQQGTMQQGAAGGGPGQLGILGASGGPPQTLDPSALASILGLG